MNTLRFILAVALAMFPLFHTEGAETIRSFDSRIEVQKNGELIVTETIVVSAEGTQIKHGIYRDFPQLYSLSGLRFKTGFSVNTVLRDKQPEEFRIARQANGVRVYMGSASTLISPGLHTYQLTYTTSRQLGFFEDHDELYWNVTGNGWVFPMETVRATVVLPQGAKAASLDGYTGFQGRREKDFTATNTGDQSVFVTSRPLAAAEGFTIVATWPKGIVSPPSSTSRLTWLLMDNLGLTLCVVGLFTAFGYYLWTWNRVGRDPKRGVIIPLYEPPRNFSPAAVRYLRMMEYDKKILTVSILDLAVKGVISIVQVKPKGIFKKKFYTLVPKSKQSGELPTEETAVAQALVPSGQPFEVKQENYEKLQSAGTRLENALEKKIRSRYFRTNLVLNVPGFFICAASAACLLLDSKDLVYDLNLIALALSLTALATISAGGKHPVAGSLSLVAILAAAVILGIFFKASVLVLTFAIGLGILVGVFANLLRAYTVEGRKILDQIEGFGKYLSVAEKDRLNLENPPERTPELFEQFLPYALALDVEQKWSEQFAGVLAIAATASEGAYSPKWYSGDLWNHQMPASFSSDMSDSLCHAISSASTAPGSASGGGDGGGGGGCSGGGGGGGGGGGW